MKTILFAVLFVGLVGVYIIGANSQTKERIAKYKKSGRLIDLLKIFSRY
jgi:hypothetical protein